jgi:hypothetical protein
VVGNTINSTIIKKITLTTRVAIRKPCCIALPTACP